jgi:hypothetical protein
MRVYNLTEKPLDYRGKMLPPNGGSLEFPELDVFIPTRDRALEEKRFVAFGSLPVWWAKTQEAPPVSKPEPQVALKVIESREEETRVYDKRVVGSKKSLRGS